MKNPFDTPERVAFRKTLRNIVAKEIKPNVDTSDETGEIPWELHQKVGALGVWVFGGLALMSSTVTWAWTTVSCAPPTMKSSPCAAPMVYPLH